jgi:GNAT superfamily N-acetyltransferase
VESDEDFEKWVATMGQGFGVAVELVQDVFSLLFNHRRDVHRFYLAESGGVPVSVAQAFCSKDVVGLNSVVILEPYRQKGFATAVCSRAMLEAKERGFKQAALWGDVNVLMLYHKLGFAGDEQLHQYI